MKKTIHSSQYKSLCKLLINERIIKKLTQGELAERLGKPQSFVSKYENCERRIDVLEFIEITKSLKIDPIKIFINYINVLEDEA